MLLMSAEMISNSPTFLPARIHFLSRPFSHPLPMLSGSPVAAIGGREAAGRSGLPSFREAEAKYLNNVFKKSVGIRTLTRFHCSSRRFMNSFSIRAFAFLADEQEGESPAGARGAACAQVPTAPEPGDARALRAGALTASARPRGRLPRGGCCFLLSVGTESSGLVSCVGSV